MHKQSRFFYDLFIDQGFNTSNSEILNTLLGTTCLIFILFVIHKITKRILLNLFKRFASKSKNTFDDALVQNKTFDYIAHIIPLTISIWTIPQIFSAFKETGNYINKALDIFGILLVIWIIRSVLRTCRDFLKSLPSFKDKPLESYIQVFMIFVWAFGILLIFSTLTDRSFWSFLTALGALSAVILLIFKDTILGFVASIQVAVNDTVRIGDWITMHKYGADGDVIEINLSSVKVQNFDKTITSIPTYYLTSQAFVNWRGMMDSGGRRIKRSLLIKTKSVRFLSDEDLKKLQQIELISDYLAKKENTINAFNSENNVDKSLLINGRNLSNLGVFRSYVEAYLKNHPDINENMTVMSRQLAPTAQGTPLEIYAFSRDKIWVNYENIVGDIFEHLLAAVSYFDLEVYEIEFSEKNTL